MKILDVTLYPKSDMNQTPTRCYIFLSKKIQNGCTGNNNMFWKGSKNSVKKIEIRKRY